MKPNPIEHVEFIGGPEDGRVLDAGDLPLLVVPDPAGGVREIPMFLRIDEGLEMEEGDELELVLIGQYVCESPDGRRLKYRWVE